MCGTYSANKEEKEIELESLLAGCLVVGDEPVDRLLNGLIERRKLEIR